MNTKRLGDAYFVLCPDCERRGYIVFPDGTRSEEIFDEDSALLAVQKAVEEKKLGSKEAEFLQTMVKGLKLPESLYMLEIAMDIVDAQQKIREAILSSSPYVCGNNLIH